MTPVLAAVESIASTVAPVAAVAATESLAVAATPVIAETIGATVAPAALEAAVITPDFAGANVITESIASATAAPTSVVATEKIKDIATGEIFPVNNPEIKTEVTNKPLETSSQVASPINASGKLETSLVQNNGDDKKEISSANQPDKNATQAKSEFSKVSTETTQESTIRLDNELKEIMDAFIKGHITELERDKKVKDNDEARKKILDHLIDRYDKNDKNLTPFEKEIAQKGAEMRHLINEIATAPKTFKAMEQELKNLKEQYKKVSNFHMDEKSANTKDAQNNTALREYIGNKIAAQAAHMARYVNITDRNLNRFISTNSDVENKLGVRNGLYHFIVNIATGIQGKLYEIDEDVETREIAKSGRMPQ